MKRQTTYRTLGGETVTVNRAPAYLPQKRKPTPARGYAMPPGTGPAGETCKTCAHIERPATRSGKVFRKCGANKQAWTHGPGSDIRAGSPACSKWAKPETKND